jgi:sulfur-oxidizing protein SoxX
MISQGKHAAVAAVAVLGCVLMTATVRAADAPAAKAPVGDVAAGKELAMDRSKGNCIACHMIPGGQAPGTIGPALVAMSARYPDVNKLHAQIYDPTVANPESAMPPFGKNRLLTEKELNDLTAYIWSL